MFISLIKRLQ